MSLSSASLLLSQAFLRGIIKGTNLMVKFNKSELVLTQPLLCAHLLKSQHYKSTLYDRRLCECRNYHRESTKVEDRSAKSNYKELERNRYFHDLLDACLENSRCQGLSTKEWDAIFAALVQQEKYGNVPVRLYQMMASQERRNGLFEVAKSLRDYIVEKGIRHSHLTLMLCYMVLLIKQHGEKALEEALSIYDQIRKEYDVLDAESINYLISVLIHTPRWKDCFELLQMLKISASPTATTYSNVVVGAIMHGDFKTAFQLLDVIHQNDMLPLDSVYEAFLTKGDQTAVERFLNYLEEKEWIPSSNAAQTIQCWFKNQFEREYDVKCKEFQSKTINVCPHCDVNLEALKPITEEEFQSLKNAFVERVLYKKGDLYLNTTPKEFKKFLQFIQQSKHFDVVIDGLNVSHNTRKKEPIKVKAQMVQSVVRYFVNQGMHVCLIAKKHILKNWPSQVLEYLNSNSTSFHTSNISEDDLFMLYAALHSGSQTYFVTRDELRDHRFLLGPEHGAVFKRWQLQRQIVFRGATSSNKLIFRWPPKHKTTVQPTPFGWHIPYDDKAEREDFKPPHSWLCLQKIKT